MMKKNLLVLLSFLILSPLPLYADPICDAAAGAWSGTEDLTVDDGSRGYITCHYPVNLQGQVQGSVLLLNGSSGEGWSPNPGVTCAGNPTTLIGSCNNGVLALNFTQGNIPLSGAIINNFLSVSGSGGSSGATVDFTLQR